MNNREKSVFITAVAIVLFMVSAASAKDLFREEFSSKQLKATKFQGHGHHPELGGWQASAPTDPVKGQDAEFAEYLMPSVDNVFSGALEFWVKRTRTGGTKWEFEGMNLSWNTVFSLVNHGNKSAFKVYIVWDYGRGKKETALSFAMDPSAGGTPFEGEVWSTNSDGMIPIGFMVPVGKWVHFVLTWGPDPVKDNRIFVNGNPIHVGGTGNLRKYLVPSQRLIVGLGTTGYPAGNSPMYEGLIGGIVLHDSFPEKLSIPPDYQPVIASVSDDTFKVAGISGKLVAGPGKLYDPGRGRLRGRVHRGSFRFDRQRGGRAGDLGLEVDDRHETEGDV
jgi:hypothetical protein